MNKYLINYLGQDDRILYSINLTYPNYFDILANSNKDTVGIEVLKPREIYGKIGVYSTE